MRSRKPAEVNVAEAQAGALAWYAWALSAMEELVRGAHRRGNEVAREGSPLFGLFDAVKLHDFATTLTDETGLASNPPRVAKMPDPLAGMPGK